MDIGPGQGQRPLLLNVNPVFLAKTQNPLKRAQLARVPSIDHLFGATDPDRLICPVRAVELFLARTSGINDKVIPLRVLSCNSLIGSLLRLRSLVGLRKLSPWPMKALKNQCLHGLMKSGEWPPLFCISTIVARRISFKQGRGSAIPRSHLFILET